MNMPGMGSNPQQAAMELQVRKMNAVNKTLAEVKPQSQFLVPSENLIDLYFNPDNFNNRYDYLANILPTLGITAARQNFSKAELESNPFLLTILDLIGEGNNYTSSTVLALKRVELETSYLRAQNNRDNKNLLSAGELGSIDKDGLVALLAKLQGVDGTMTGVITTINKAVHDLLPILDTVRQQNAPMYALLKLLIAFVDYGVVTTHILSKLSKKAASMDPSATVNDATIRTGYDLPEGWDVKQDTGKSIGNIIRSTTALIGNISQSLLNAGLMFNADYFQNILANVSQETLSYANKLIIGQGGTERVVEDSLIQGIGTAFSQTSYFISQNPNYNNPAILNTLYTIALIGAVASNNNAAGTLEAIYNTLGLPYSAQNLTQNIQDVGPIYTILTGLSLQNPHLIVGYYRMRYFNSPDYADFAKTLYLGKYGYGGVININYITQLKQQHQQSAINASQVTQDISRNVGLLENMEIVQTLVSDIIAAATYA